MDTATLPTTTADLVKINGMEDAPAVTDRDAFVKHAIKIMKADDKVKKQTFGVVFAFLDTPTADDAENIAKEIGEAARKAKIEKNGALEQTINAAKKIIGTPVAAGLKTAVMRGDLRGHVEIRTVSRMLSAIDPTTKKKYADDPRVTAGNVAAMCRAARLTADDKGRGLLEVLNDTHAGRTPVAIALTPTPFDADAEFAKFKADTDAAKKAATATQQAAGSAITPQADPVDNGKGNAQPDVKAEILPGSTPTTPASTPAPHANKPADKTEITKTMFKAWGVTPTAPMINAMHAIMIAASGMQTTDDVVFVLNSAREGAEDAATERARK